MPFRNQVSSFSRMAQGPTFPHMTTASWGWAAAAPFRWGVGSWRLWLSLLWPWPLVLGAVWSLSCAELVTSGLLYMLSDFAELTKLSRKRFWKISSASNNVPACSKQRPNFQHQRPLHVQHSPLLQVRQAQSHWLSQFNNWPVHTLTDSPSVNPTWEGPAVLGIRWAIFSIVKLQIQCLIQPLRWIGFIDDAGRPQETGLALHWWPAGPTCVAQRPCDLLSFCVFVFTPVVLYSDNSLRAGTPKPHWLSFS